MIFFSPAKVNLFLHVVGKREDGYHNIASLFHAIDLKDTLTFSLSCSDLITCTDPRVPTDSRNLVFRARELFRKNTGKCTSYHIHIAKKIPPGAGLGGGSSNGATTLWALNALHGFPVSENVLQQWSTEIGSDVPFFFSLGTAYCTGRGENVKNLPPLTCPYHLSLSIPHLEISTSKIFSLFKTKQTIDPQLLLAHFSKGELYFYNDLEPLVFNAYPAMLELKKNLQSHFQSVSMTGSGSAFICQGDPIPSTLPIQLIRRSPHHWY